MLSYLCVKNHQLDQVEKSIMFFGACYKLDLVCMTSCLFVNVVSIVLLA